MGIEDEFVETIALVDLGSDGDGTLVSKLAAELDVVEGDSVVGRLGPAMVMLARELCAVGSSHIMRNHHTKLGGYLCLKPCLRSYS
jgi:hypothetical protein